MSYSQQQLEEAAKHLRQQELQDARDSGYNQGYRDGYENGNNAKFPLVGHLIILLSLTLLVGLIVSAATMSFTS